ncbi:acyltransferase domain-containing protein [Photorhabdus asymbiotica]|uniref:acyltransferase domain-containing protein n=1 Tax=Photorhabdus asymbiotica TaxID=291112 RepID=UPI003DA73CD2
MFPGQGSQSIEMGQSLYLHDGVFRQQFDRCAELLQPHIKLDIRQLIYPQSERDNAISRLNATRYTQPALFIVEYALACQLQAWGITPQAMIGHSLGELVAACVGGDVRAGRCTGIGSQSCCNHATSAYRGNAGSTGII